MGASTFWRELILSNPTTWSALFNGLLMIALASITYLGNRRNALAIENLKHEQGVKLFALQQRAKRIEQRMAALKEQRGLLVSIKLPPELDYTNTGSVDGWKQRYDASVDQCKMMFDILANSDPFDANIMDELESAIDAVNQAVEDVNKDTHNITDTTTERMVGKIRRYRAAVNAIRALHRTFLMTCVAQMGIHESRLEEIAQIEGSTK